MGAPVGAPPEAEEDDHDEAAGDAHGDRLRHDVRHRRHARERGERERQNDERRDEHVSKRPAVGEGPGGEVPHEGRDGRHRQRPVVDLRRESALGENRLVEQADARGHKAVRRAGQGEHPECR